ncbi:putative membrane protein [Nocardioides aromaticivorans]|uniref:Putative membrane protein n=1 Tax=Nocardioides aromaticivorans TaxID=200618 RepID=A0A7Z0CJZ4_9ACTN|nr:heparan-alpha-glucosaminide N-acetyltransferase domain-containing protein [Nocardioides aromaticivorans]NYI43619.1 putative membrane protein [Nocardioides aromaticivorans]
MLRVAPLREGRLVGIDVARTVALVGMIATHVLDGRTTTGELTTVQWLAGGRASALFAVLAGVSIALMSGGAHPVRGSERTRTVLGLAARAVLVALLGLALGGLETSLAIILAYYGVLFLLGLPFIGLRAVPLAVLAGVWLVAAPVASHLVRPSLPVRDFASPDFSRFVDPGPLLADLLLTGYYPAVPWLAYLLAGMAIGRTDLTGWRTPLRLAACGLGLAVVATAVSRLCTSSLEVRTALVPHRVTTEDELLRMLSGSQHGTTPTDGAWQWLLVVSPHSATPFDLAQTIGSALVVIGLALALADVLPRWGRAALAVLAGAGAMPLSLYTLHVVMRTPDVWPAEQERTFGWHVAVVLGVGAVFALLGRRGPLEWLVGWPGRRLRRGVRTG